MDGLPRFNVYAETCPARLALDRIADKWSVLLLVLLRAGPLRFNQLRREVQGLSQKVLAQTLRRMERDGLVTRTAYATVPVTVEYALTPLGHGLAEAMDGVARWAEANVGAMLAAQREYDARVAVG